MCAVVFAENDICVPDWVNDFGSFRRWSDSDEFPEEGRISFLKDKIWIDMSKEQVFSHGELKSNVSSVITQLVLRFRMGRYICDGVRLIYPGSMLSNVPDGVFVSTKSLRAGRIRLVEGAARGWVELEGTADMVLEVVSDSSVDKDTGTLFDLYWHAGIPEYWLIDAREDIRFEIYRHRAKGYVAVRPQAGWVHSRTFGRWFRLVLEYDELGLPQYLLKAKV